MNKLPIGTTICVIRGPDAGSTFETVTGCIPISAVQYGYQVKGKNGDMVVVSVNDLVNDPYYQVR